MKNNIVLKLLVVVALLITWGCSESPQQDSSNISIASILSLTGPAGALGEQIKIGQEIAVEFWKEKGINVKLKVVDNKCAPNEAISAFQMLKAQGYHIFVANLSGISQKLKPLIEPSQTLIAMGSIPSITNPPKQGVYRYSQTAEEEAEALLKWGTSNNNLSGKVLFIIYSEDDYGLGFAEQMEHRAEEIGLEVSKVAYTSSDADKMRTIVQSKIPDENYIPVVVGIGNPMVQAITYLRTKGYQGPILCNIGYSVSRAKDILGDDAGKIVYTVLVNNPLVAETFLSTNYAQKTDGKNLTAEALAGFNSIYMLVQAVQEVGSTKSEQINSIIVQTGRSIASSHHAGGENEIVFGVTTRED